jgi:hypothetical protein
MPAKNESQANWMRMSLAVKHGHELKGLRRGTMARLRETAKSMTDKQLRDFSHVAKRPKKKG